MKWRRQRDFPIGRHEAIYHVMTQVRTGKKEEMIMAIDKSLLSGSTAMLLLKLLSEKDMYGYEMIETLQTRSENVFELKAGTLYPLLHQMEDKGWLKVYEQEVLGKVRKYYSITEKGRRELAAKQEEWNTYSKAVTTVLYQGV